MIIVLRHAQDISTENGQRGISQISRDHARYSGNFFKETAFKPGLCLTSTHLKHIQTQTQIEETLGYKIEPTLRSSDFNEYDSESVVPEFLAGNPQAKVSDVQQLRRIAKRAWRNGSEIGSET